MLVHMGSKQETIISRETGKADGCMDGWGKGREGGEFSWWRGVGEQHHLIELLAHIIIS